jgi:hypothetical protein
MVQLTPQSRIFLATQPVDFRNYAELTIMPSPALLGALGGDLLRLLLGITAAPPQDECSMARSLSGAWKRPRRSESATPASNTASFSVGSARR